MTGMQPTPQCHRLGPWIWIAVAALSLLLPALAAAQGDDTPRPTLRIVPTGGGAEGTAVTFERFQIVGELPASWEAGETLEARIRTANGTFATVPLRRGREANGVVTYSSRSVMWWPERSLSVQGVTRRSVDAAFGLDDGVAPPQPVGVEDAITGLGGLDSGEQVFAVIEGLERPVVTSFRNFGDPEARTVALNNDVLTGIQNSLARRRQEISRALDGQPTGSERRALERERSEVESKIQIVDEGIQLIADEPTDLGRTQLGFTYIGILNNPFEESGFDESDYAARIDQTRVRIPTMLAEREATANERERERNRREFEIELDANLRHELGQVRGESHELQLMRRDLDRAQADLRNKRRTTTTSSRRRLELEDEVWEAEQEEARLLAAWATRRDEIARERRAGTFVGPLVGPNDTVVNVTVQEGLVLRRNIYVAQLRDIANNFDAEAAKTDGEKRSLISSLYQPVGFGRENTDAAHQLIDARRALIYADRNASDVNNKFESAHDYLLRRANEDAQNARRATNPNVRAALEARAAELREDAANSRWGRYQQRRRDYYRLLDQNPILGTTLDRDFQVPNDGPEISEGTTLFDAFNRLTNDNNMRGATLGDALPNFLGGRDPISSRAQRQQFVDLLDGYLASAARQARQEAREAAAVRDIDGLAKFASPQYARQGQAGIMLGDQLGSNLPRLLMADVEGYYAAYTSDPETIIEDAVIDLSLGVVAGGGMLIPVVGPAITASAVAVQVYRDGDDLVIAYLDEEQARQAASLGAASNLYRITAEDRAEAARNKFIVTILTSALDLNGIRGVRSARGGTTAAGTGAGAIDDLAAAGAGTARRIPRRIPPTGAASLDDELARGLAKAEELGIPEDEQIDRWLRWAQDPAFQARAHGMFQDLARIEQTIAAARAAGVSDDAIQAALARAASEGNVSAYTGGLMEDLSLLRANTDGAIIVVDPGDADVFPTFAAGVEPGRVIELDLNRLQDIKTRLALGQELSPEDLLFLRTEVLAHGDDLSRLREFVNEPGRGFGLAGLVDDEFVEAARAAVGGRPGIPEGDLDFWLGREAPEAVLAELDGVIRGAQTNGATSDSIRAALDRVRQAGVLDPSTIRQIEQELILAAARDQRLTVAIQPALRAAPTTEIQEFLDFAGGLDNLPQVRPVDLIELSTIKSQLALGNQLTPEQLRFLADEILPHGDDLLRWREFRVDEIGLRQGGGGGLYSIFDQEVLDQARRAVDEAGLAGGGRRAALDPPSPPPPPLNPPDGPPPANLDAETRIDPPPNRTGGTGTGGRPRTQIETPFDPPTDNPTPDPLPRRRPLPAETDPNATRTDLAPNAGTNPDATPTAVFEGDDALLLRARLERSGDAASFRPDELARLRQLLDNPGGFGSRFGHQLTPDDLNALGRSLERRSPTGVLDIEIPPAGRTGPGDTEVINRTGPGQTQPLERTGPGQTQPLERTGPGQTQPIERTGPGQTQPLERTGPGQTQPIERTGPGQTQPVTRSVDARGAGGTELTSPDGSPSGASTLRDAPVAPGMSGGGGPSIEDLVRQARANDVFWETIDEVVRNAGNADEARAGLRREITRARASNQACWRRFWENQDEIADNAAEFARDAGVPEERIAEIIADNPADSVDRGMELLREALERQGYDLDVPTDELRRLQEIYVRGAARRANPLEPGLSPDDIDWLRERLDDDPLYFERLPDRGRLSAEEGFEPLLSERASRQLEEYFDEATGGAGAANAAPGPPVGGAGGSQLVDLSAQRSAELGRPFYAVHDSAQPSLHTVASLENGDELIISLRTETPGGQRSPVLRGQEQFARILQHFDGQFTGIRGAWTYGDNLADFNRLTGEGLSPQEAALRTWTGQRATEAGYGEVVVRVLEGEAGAYDDVQVLFTRP